MLFLVETHMGCEWLLKPFALPDVDPLHPVWQMCCSRLLLLGKRGKHATVAATMVGWSWALWQEVVSLATSVASVAQLFTAV